jgi:hypothetical protein
LIDDGDEAESDMDCVSDSSAYSVDSNTWDADDSADDKEDEAEDE